MKSALPDNIEEWADRIRHGEIGLLDLLFLEELIRQESSGTEPEEHK